MVDAEAEIERLQILLDNELQESIRSRLECVTLNGIIKAQLELITEQQDLLKTYQDFHTYTLDLMNRPVGE